MALRKPKWKPKIFPKKKTEHRQEIHCHGCDNWVQFIVDVALNGNHVLECPSCGHEHCRVVKDGEITDIRWDQRNGPTIYVTSTATYTSASVFQPIYDTSCTSGGTYTTATNYFDWGN